MQPGTERGARQPARPGFWVTVPDFAAAVEDVDRAGGEGGDVDVRPVGRDGEPLRRAQRAAEGAADGAQPDQAADGAFLLGEAAGARERVKEVTLLLNSEVT